MNTLNVGDALEYTRSLPDNSVDLVITSPPYDAVRDYGGEWAIDLPALGADLLRVVKDGGFAVVVINDGTKDFRKSLTSFRTAIAWVDAGWSLFETIIYARDGRPGGWWSKRFRVDHEYIFLFFKGTRPRPLHKDHLQVPSKHSGRTWSGSVRRTDGGLAKVENAPVNDLKCRGTIWKYGASNTEGNKLKMQHPATFPDKLARDLILALSSEGDVVYDPMMGSGTVPFVAAQENRAYLGNDINADYVLLADLRMAAL